MSEPVAGDPAPGGDACAPRRWSSTLKAVYSFARGAFALIGLYTIVFSLFFDLGKIVSPSMQPTLQGTCWDDGDWVLSENISLWFRPPKRWEVVRIRADDGLMIMKRIAGLPGETIQLVDGKPVIDGQTRQPPPSLGFLHYFAYGPHSHNGKITTCGTGYFVLGDDSKDSLDSRYEGPVDPSKIQSRAVLRVWPPARIGWINP